MSDEIIGLADWLQTPPGRCVTEWELAQFEQAVADVFGFHALQLGQPALPALAGSRMPHRWVLANEGDAPLAEAQDRVAAWADPAGLPFAASSIDLVVMPHTLELSADPQGVLREVERVLVPEGRVVLSVFNPLSLWGLRQARAHLCARVGLKALGRDDLFLPKTGDFVAPWRLRDWLRFLDLELEYQRFGIYRWSARSERWLARGAWLERVGARWWPVFGAVYVMVAVKRVRGMRLLGPAWRPYRPPVQASVTAAPR